MPASVGEDYSGPEFAPATDNETTTILDLKFLHPVPGPSVGMLSENGETRLPMANIAVIVAGFTFVALAATSVAVMLEAAQPSRSGTIKTRLIAVHRVGTSQ
jgi:hypothetical protein